MGIKLRNLMLGVAVGLLLFATQASAETGAVRELPNGEIRVGEGGYVRVTAIGLPPFGASDDSTAQEVARQNALGIAQRRLLSAILQLPVAPNKPTVRVRLAARPQMRSRLRELIARARVSGQELADGSAEVTLELPFSGSGGLSEFLIALSR